MKNKILKYGLRVKDSGTILSHKTSDYYGHKITDLVDCVWINDSFNKPWLVDTAKHMDRRGKYDNYLQQLSSVFFGQAIKDITFYTK